MKTKTKETLFEVPVLLKIQAKSYEEAVKTAMLYLQDIKPEAPDSLYIIEDWDEDNEDRRVIYLARI